MRYNIYRTMTGQMARLAKKVLGLTKAKTGADFADTIIKRMCRSSEFLMSLNAAVAMSECDWDAEGNRVYFLIDPGLVDILWRAKMDLLPEDLDGFLRAFSLSFPSGCAPSGVELSGCLIWWGKFEDRYSTAVRFSKRYLDGAPLQVNEIKGAKRANPGERVLRIAYTCGHGEKAQSVMVAIPERFISRSLRSEDGIEEIGTFEDVPLSLPITKGEWRVQYALARMAIHMMVYVQACPAAVREGFPDSVRERDAKGRWDRRLSPSMIGMPDGEPSTAKRWQGGTHGSPEPHWRKWFFRRHPIKKDGTRTAGPVFVHATMVGKKIDPVTVVGPS